MTKWNKDFVIPYILLQWNKSDSNSTLIQLVPMNKSEFNKASPGQLVKNFDGHLAFIPSALPPKIAWSEKLVSILSNADRCVGRLAGLGAKLPNPRRLVQMFLRREAELSSRIEQTFARVQTMVLWEQLPDIEHDTPSVREVENNFRALEFTLKSAENRPLTCGLIREMHEVLMRDVRGGDMRPGQFRNVQAHIGRSHDIQTARFVPPPSHEVEPCMRQLEVYLRKPDELPPIVRAAIVHYQFEAIHPFSDGNGRIGRVLLLLQLVQEGVLPAPLLNPSAQLELRRDAYYDALLGVSMRGEWENWIRFFAESLAAESQDAAKRIERLESLREAYQLLIRKHRASSLASGLVDDLFVEPSVTTKDVAKKLKIGNQSAQNTVDRLVNVGILREVTGRQRNRVYLAQGVVDLFSTEPSR